MKRIILLFLLFSGIFLFYFLLSPVKVYKKSIYHLSKIINLDEYTLKKNSTPDFFFNDGKDCYYFNLNGEVINHVSAGDDYFIKANKLFYTIYNKKGDMIEIYSAKGDLLTTLKTSGYPFIPENLPLFAVINLSGMGFSLYTVNGEILIRQIDFPSLITSVSFDKSYNVLVSTLDGESKYFSSNGKIMFETTSENSRIKITKSNCINSKGTIFAVCSGLYPEYMEIFNKKGMSLVNRFDTGNNMRYRIFMKITNSELFYESNSGIDYYDFKHNSHGRIRINGTIKKISISGKGDILVYTVYNNLNCLTAYTLKGRKLFYKEFNDEINDIIFTSSKSFFFKTADRVIKMELDAS